MKRTVYTFFNEHRTLATVVSAFLPSGVVDAINRWLLSL